MTSRQTSLACRTSGCKGSAAARQPRCTSAGEHPSRHDPAGLTVGNQAGADVALRLSLEIVQRHPVRRKISEEDHVMRRFFLTVLAVAAVAIQITAQSRSFNLPEG